MRHRLAFICDVPDNTTTVLSHSARHTLSTTLAAVGLSLDEALVASVWPVPAVLVGKLDWSGAAVQRSIVSLLEALTEFRPNLVVLLGNDPKSPSHAALHLFKSGNVAPPTTKGGKVKWEWATGLWRGSLFLSNDQLYPPYPPSRQQVLPSGPTEPCAGCKPNSVGLTADAGMGSAHYGASENLGSRSPMSGESPQCSTDWQSADVAITDVHPVAEPTLAASPSAPVSAPDATTTAAPPAPTECIRPQQRLLTAARGDVGTGFSAGGDFCSDAQPSPNDKLPSYVALNLLAAAPGGAAASTAAYSTAVNAAAPLAVAATPHTPGPLRVSGSNVPPPALASTAPLKLGAAAVPGDDEGPHCLAAVPTGGCDNELESVVAASSPLKPVRCASTQAGEGAGRRFCLVDGDFGNTDALTLSEVRFCPAPFKCMATWHPAFVNRAWSHYLTELRCDIRRAKDESLMATLVLDECLIEFGPAAV